MSRTKPCPSCDRPIVETARTCCFCGRDTEARRPTLTAICYPLTDGITDSAPPTVDSAERTAAVVHAFPGGGSARPTVAAEPVMDASPKSSPERLPAGGGEPPDSPRSVIRTQPPLSVVVLMIVCIVLLVVPARVFPKAAGWMEMTRMFISVFGQYWVLLAPFTARTPMILLALALPMLVGRNVPGRDQLGLGHLDVLLLFLTAQALAISIFRSLRWKGRGLMALSSLDEDEEGRASRCGSFDV